MSRFHIVKKNELKSESFRVAKLKSDFDIQTEHSNETFSGEIKLPENWQIGVISGGSGTGKTTIAKELFPDYYFENHLYSDKPVIDEMPENVTNEEIQRMFYAVGFGSVPSWLKPYNVLSNGEKMRVDLARSLLSSDFVVFDEFTSVVDRTVAKTMCRAIQKTMKRYPNKKFIGVTCHFDVIEHLQPDWLFDTNEMKQVFQYPHCQQRHSTSKNAQLMNGDYLGVITI